MTKIALIGSRDWPQPDAVRQFVTHLVSELPRTAILVSGGARGIDQWAAMAARDRQLEVTEYLPDIPPKTPRWKTRSYLMGRNTLIIQNADRIIAVWNGESSGTWDALYKATCAKKPITIYDGSGIVRPEWLERVRFPKHKANDKSGDKI